MRARALASSSLRRQENAWPYACLSRFGPSTKRLALDGRDPNSYSGIFGVLGRYDRPWGPERPIFGKVRYLSSAATARKLRLGESMARYGGER